MNLTQLGLTIVCTVFGVTFTFAQDTIGRANPEMIVRGDPRADTANKQFVIDNEPEALTPLQSLIVYPEQARHAGFEGKVIISAIVDTNGKVLKVRIDKSTHPIFEEPAKQALLNCRFKPAYQNGKPVKLWYTVPILFRMPQD